MTPRLYNTRRASSPYQHRIPTSRITRLPLHFKLLYPRVASLFLHVICPYYIFYPPNSDYLFAKKRKKNQASTVKCIILRPQVIVVTRLRCICSDTPVCKQSRALATAAAAIRADDVGHQLPAQTALLHKYRYRALGSIYTRDSLMNSSELHTRILIDTMRPSDARKSSLMGLGNAHRLTRLFPPTCCV